MRLVAVVVLLLGSAALADVPTTTCGAAGEACVTDEGSTGKCAVIGNELICVPVVSAAGQRALPWVGAGLAFLALCDGVATRRPQVHSAA